MRLITHNMLQCHVKGCKTDNFPLAFKSVQLEAVEAEFQPELLKRLLYKLEWPALITSLNSLKAESNQTMKTDEEQESNPVDINELALPEEMPEQDVLESDEFLQKLHRVLLETRVMEGAMVCRGCGHIYQIKNGIPNMLLQDNEV